MKHNPKRSSTTLFSVWNVSGDPESRQSGSGVCSVASEWFFIEQLRGRSPTCWAELVAPDAGSCEAAAAPTL